MYRHVLIGIDELDGGTDAVALARALAEPDATLTLIRVHGGYETVGRREFNSLRDAERRTAEVALRRACRITGLREAWAYGAPNVATGLEQLAGYLGSDLIVFGSGTQAPIGLTSIPSCMLETLPRTNCALAVAPAGYASWGGSLSRIGIGYEETPEGQRALNIGRHLGEAHHAEVSVFERFSDGIEFSRGVSADAARRLHDFTNRVDLMVLGARGGGPLRRMTHASATPSLVQGISAPLMMVTAQTEAPFGTGHPVAEQWTTKIGAVVRAL